LSDATGIPEELSSTCKTWAAALEALKGDLDRIAYIQEELPTLIGRRALFMEILSGIESGAPYPDTRRSTLFNNEVILYQDERRRFSLRLFLAGPGEYTPIHDHNAWGVITPLIGRLGVTSYRRLDDGSEELAAHLEENRSRVLDPGESGKVLPLNKGIHRTGNEGRGVMVMVSVYGLPVRRPYILGYNPDERRAYRMYSPRTGKRVHAKEALVQMGY